MLFNKKKSKKLGKKISLIIAVLMISSSTVLPSFAADNEFNSIMASNEIESTVTSRLSESGNENNVSLKEVIDIDSETVNISENKSENKSSSGIYTPNADLYGDILVKEHNENDIDNKELKDKTKYDTEHEKVYEAKPGSKLDYMATINGKEVEKQYKEILENSKKVIDNRLGQGNADNKLGEKGEKINITKELDLTMTLKISPDPMLKFPDAFKNYILDAEDTDSSGKKRVWCYIDEGLSDVKNHEKTIVIKLNFWNDKNNTNKDREGSIEIVNYDDLAPFIVGNEAKIKKLNLFIKGVKLGEEAIEGKNYTVKSNIEGTFKSNPNLSLVSMGSPFDWDTFTDIYSSKEDYVKFNWKAIQETKENNNLDGRDNTLVNGDDSISLTVRVPKEESLVVPEKPIQPEVPKKEEKQPEVPKKEEKQPEAPKKEEQQPEVPKKEEQLKMPKKEEKQPEEPKKEKKQPEIPKKEEKQGNKIKFNTNEKKKNTLPQLGFESMTSTFAILGTLTSVLSVIGIKRK